MSGGADDAPEITGLPDVGGGRLWSRVKLLLFVWLFIETINFLFWEMAPDLLLMNSASLQSIPFTEGVVLRVLALVPVLFLPTHIELPSQVVVWLLYLIVYASTVMLGRSVGINSLVDFLPLLFVMLVSLLSCSLLGRLPRTTKIPEIAPRGTSRIIIALLLAATLGISIHATGSLVFQSSYEDLYDKRDEFLDLVRAAGGASILGYLTAPLATVLAPLLAAWGTLSKRYLLLSVGLLVSIIDAFQTGERAALLGTVLAALTAGWLSSPTVRKSRFKPEQIIVFLAGVALAGYVLDKVRSFDQVFWQFSEFCYFRVHAVPAVVSSLYYDFFSVNPPALWSYATGSGPLSWLIGSDPIYEVTPARLIGQTYFWSAETNANANPWFNGYAEAGLVGTVFESTLLLAYLFVLDRIAISRNVPIVLATAISIGFCLCNVAMPTALVTNGLTLLVLLLVLTRRDELAEPNQATTSPLVQWEQSDGVGTRGNS